MTAELQKKIESEMLKSMEQFIGRKATPDVRAQIMSTCIEQLRRSMPDAPIDLEVVADEHDPTSLTLVPKNAWTGLTMVLGDKYPDALPVAFNATRVETPIGTFSWERGQVMFTPIPTHSMGCLEAGAPLTPLPTSGDTVTDDLAKKKQECLDIMQRESDGTAHMAMAELPKTFTEAGDRIWRAFRAGQYYAQAQARLQQLRENNGS